MAASALLVVLMGSLACRRIGRFVLCVPELPLDGGAAVAVMMDSRTHDQRVWFGMLQMVCWGDINQWLL